MEPGPEDTCTDIAYNQPQSAYCALTQSLNTTNNISAHLKPIARIPSDMICYQ